MPTVLVVEDNVDNLDLIVDVVRLFDYDSRTAVTVADALHSVRNRRPDAVLLDITLPDASGTAGLDQLRRLLPGVPIIMVTGNTDVVIARDTLKRGAFDYITKPFDVERLKGVLEAALVS